MGISTGFRSDESINISLTSKHGVVLSFIESRRAMFFKTWLYQFCLAWRKKSIWWIEHKELEADEEREVCRFTRSRAAKHCANVPTVLAVHWSVREKHIWYENIWSRHVITRKI